MNRSATNLVGIFLILGAAVGYALGLVLSDPAVAAIYGAGGAGLGIVIGAIASSLTRQEHREGR